MLTARDITTAILNPTIALTREDLESIYDAARRRGTEISMQQAGTFHPGDIVWFRHDSRKYIGTVDKVNIKTVSVTVTRIEPTPSFPNRGLPQKWKVNGSNLNRGD